MSEYFKLYSSGNYKEILNKLKSLDLVSLDNQTLNILGASALQLAENEYALKVYKALYSKIDDDPNILSNLAVALRRCNKLEKASYVLQKSLRINDNNVSARSNLALVNIGLKNYPQAIFNAEEALKLSPNDRTVLINLGYALYLNGDADRSCEVLSSASNMYPNDSEILTHLGKAYWLKSDVEMALNNLQSAFSLDRNNILTFQSVCDLYDKLNDFEKLERVLVDNPHFNNEPVFMFFTMLLSYRRNRFQECVDQFKELTKYDIPNELLCAAYEIGGKAYEKLQLFSKAFEQFIKMNEIAVKGQAGLNNLSHQYFSSVENQYNVGFINFLRSTSSDNDLNISFQIGFPRSGTTLLDTMLGANSLITVLEEKPFVAKLAAEFDCLFDINKISSLSSKDVSDIRSRYLSLAKFTPTLDRFLVDKLPLNLFQIPFILKVFPESKFIFCLRNPKDVALSNFKQNFKLNEAMFHMTSLERIINLYDLALKTYFKCKTELNISVHEIKYEDLVSNSQKELLDLCSFLNVPYAIEMLDNVRASKERGYVSTPSASQIIQPIYKSSIRQFEKYETTDEDLFNGLNYWCALLGYT